MILVLAGTQDGREIVAELIAAGYPVTASVVSDYGKKLLSDVRVSVNNRPFTAEELEEFLLDKRVEVIVDATHPYAVNISRTAIELSKKLGIFYIRYERDAIELTGYRNVFSVADFTAAAIQAGDLGETIFLTTGSRSMHIFKESACLEGKKLIVRVLPDPDVVAACAALGFTPDQIVAMQGPFSHKLNLELYKKYAIDVVVTKNSGSIGGADTKITAAQELGIPVVVIGRTQIDYPLVVHTSGDILNLLKEWSVKAWNL